MQFSLLTLLALAASTYAAVAAPPQQLEKRCDCTNIVGNSWGCDDPLQAGWNYCQRYYNNAYYTCESYNDGGLTSAKCCATVC